MSLRQKIPLWVVSVTAALSLLTWGLQRLVVIPCFVELERGMARHAVERMTATIGRERENLRVRCMDWANWDEAYRFVQDRNQAFVDANLTGEWFSVFRLNLMVFCDLSGDVVWGGSRATQSGEDLDVVTAVSQFLSVDPEVVRSVARGEEELLGIAMTQRGPMLIAGHPIHRTDQSGPSVGALIFGSPLGDRELADMAGLEAGSVRWWDLRKPLPADLAALSERIDTAGGIAYLDDASQPRSALTVFRDAAGRPVVMVQACFARDITDRGVAACRLALFSVLLMGLLMLLLVVLLLNRSVVKPVLEVIDHVAGVGRTQDLRLHVEGSASGEVCRLADEFNQMLDRLDKDHARRHEAEDQLRRVEEQYHRLFDDSVLGVFQSTPDGRFLNVNDALARICGYADARELQDSVKRIDTDVYLDAGRRAEFVRLVEEQGSVTAFESRVRRKDGSVCWISEKARVVRDEASHVLFYEGMVEDITHRKLAEDELHILSRALDQSPASIIITDPEGKIQYVNRKFSEVSGYATAEVLGQKPSLLKSGLMPDEVYRDLWVTITSGREWHGELQNRKRTGELHWEWASISPILGARGEVTHFLAVKEDITDRKESDDTLHQTMDQLERFNRLAIGREKRIIELKGAINELLARLGEPPRYQVGRNAVCSESELQTLLAGV